MTNTPKARVFAHKTDHNTKVQSHEIQTALEKAAGALGEIMLMEQLPGGRLTKSGEIARIALSSLAAKTTKGRLNTINNCVGLPQILHVHDMQLFLTMDKPNVSISEAIKAYKEVKTFEPYKPLL